MFGKFNEKNYFQRSTCWRKYELFMPEINYLGQDIDKSRRKRDASRLTAITICLIRKIS